MYNKKARSYFTKRRHYLLISLTLVLKKAKYEHLCIFIAQLIVTLSVKQHCHGTFLHDPKRRKSSESAATYRNCTGIGQHHDSMSG